MRMIGITPSLGEKETLLNYDYANAVIRAGALPVVLPVTEDGGLMDEMLRRVDGLLLSGGADVNPACYGEAKLPFCGDITPRRDAFEFALCRKALEKDLPLLAVCRGHQVLNCVMGGSLYQDISAQMEGARRHPCYETPRDPVHPVLVEQGSLLNRITGRETLQVNSRHHQGIKALGRGLRAIAWAEDGLIESVELPGKRFVLGVQWHPESLSDRYPEAQRLFDALAEACGA